MSIATKKPSIFFISAISITSAINLPLFPICLFLTYAVCYEKIKSGRTSFNFSERASNIIFKSTSNKEIGLQFFMNLLSLCFFFQ